MTSFDFWLLLPESSRDLLFCANKGFCYLNLAGIIKFDKKHEVDSGSSGKITPSCKRPIAIWALHNFMYMIL